MEKFEFKSAVCTTKEQSERLLSLGLKKETADMVYTNASLPFIEEKFNIICKEYSQLNNEVNYEISPFTFIPAWSLHRLIEMSLNLSYGVAYCYTAGSNMNVTYDEVIDMIEWAISKECFNKDYLEEKK